MLIKDIDWPLIWLFESYRKLPISQPNSSVEKNKLIIKQNQSIFKNYPGLKPKSHFIARQQYQSVKLEKDSSTSIKIEKGEFSFDLIDKGGKISEGFFNLAPSSKKPNHTTNPKMKPFTLGLVVWFGVFKDGQN